MVQAHLGAVGAYAFSNCPQLEKIWLPSNLDTILTYTFAWCPNLTRIHIPDTTKVIEKKAFYNQDLIGLQTIYCQPDTAAYDYAVLNDFKIEIE